VSPLLSLLFQSFSTKFKTFLCDGPFTGPYSFSYYRSRAKAVVSMVRFFAQQGVYKPAPRGEIRAWDKTKDDSIFKLCGTE